LRHYLSPRSRSLNDMLALALLVGVFGVYAGWHWKLMHRSWQDVGRYKRQAKGYIPGVRQARTHHTGKAFWFVIAAVALILILVH
jgi:hypothetical protein